MESILDKFSSITLKVLTYLFLLSAIVSVIMWMTEEDTYYSKATPWVVWVSAILMSLFFAAISHTVARVIDRVHKEEYETEDEERVVLPVYDSEGNQIN